MIYLAADHRGFEKKTKIYNYLAAKSLPVEDLGPYVYDKDDDYNDPAIAVAKSVRKSFDNRGILLCGSANGVLIQANRFKNIRAIAALETEPVKLGREHNDANILCLSADFLDFEQMTKLIDIFLETKFSGEPRHSRRNSRLDERVDYV